MKAKIINPSKKRKTKKKVIKKNNPVINLNKNELSLLLNLVRKIYMFQESEIKLSKNEMQKFKTIYSKLVFYK